jgi:hypothetical protein
MAPDVVARPAPGMLASLFGQGEPLDRRSRFHRALLAVVLWAVAVLPASLRVQRCSFAKLFHRPCPGCGMTRAIDLLLLGDWRASLHMHPLAVPMVVAGGGFALSTVWTTFRHGMPLVHKSTFGRVALAALAVTYVATFVLWILRCFGDFGGPVPVF